MLLKIVLTLAVLAAILAIVVWRQPSTFRVARSITVAAPPAAVFAEINDLRRFERWNPWARIDPDYRARFAGPAAGVGSSCAWDSKKVGTGRMTIIAAREPELVRMQLEFLTPMKSTSTAEFTVTAAGNQTVVTWTMAGAQTLPGKVMGLVMNMDRMLGGEFEKGLATLKTIVEAPAVARQ